MAIYHLSAKIISRADGRPAVAAAAYRSAGRLRDERQGVEHDYSRKSGVVHTEVMVPDNTPDWMRDRAKLWNAVELVEKRRDAQLSREIELSLPRELDRSAQLELLRGFVTREFVERGMIADVAVHQGVARDGAGQPHAHVMLTTRELTGSGFGKKDRSWNEADVLLVWRKAWAEDVNIALERNGYDERVDHRRLDVQRTEMETKAFEAFEQQDNQTAFLFEQAAVELDRAPEPKIGPAAYAQEKRGLSTDRGELFREVKARNAERLAFGLAQLELKLVERGKMFLEAAHSRLEQLWGRLEDAVSRIRGRVIGDSAPPNSDADDKHEDVQRLAVLGRAVEHQAPYNADRENERNIPASEVTRAAILGRGKTDGPNREDARGRDRER